MARSFQVRFYAFDKVLSKHEMILTRMRFVTCEIAVSLCSIY